MNSAWCDCACGCGLLYFGMPGSLHRGCRARVEEMSGRNIAKAVQEWRQARAELAKKVAPVRDTTAEEYEMRAVCREYAESKGRE